jgi:exoribonuclease R
MPFIPESHYSLGVDRYLQASSPIRRFVDFLHNYQLINFLRGGQPLGSEELRLEFFKSEESIKNSSISEKFRRKFLILLYAKENNDNIYDGVVVAKKRKPMVLVERLNFTTECMNIENKDVKIGEHLKVKCSHIDFLGGFMKFERVVS